MFKGLSATPFTDDFFVLQTTTCTAKLVKNRCRLDLRQHFSSERLIHRWNSLEQCVCCTSPHPGLLRLHFFYHRRPRRAKYWVSPCLTGAMVPPKFHLRSRAILRILLYARPSSRQLTCGSRSGVGTIVQRDEDLVDYTAGTSLSGRRLPLAFALTKLNFDKE